ncbi:hypothetical protein [uncultured Croceitalea sp.]|uniref:hypothetical protein n=1 Tax=uncultured Croceitalea sp. TaxID=1798908 RepID=UPI0033063B5A
MKKIILVVCLVGLFVGCTMNPSKEERIQKLETEIKLTTEKVKELENKVKKLEELYEQLERK